MPLIQLQGMGCSDMNRCPETWIVITLAIGLPSGEWLASYYFSSYWRPNRVCWPWWHSEFFSCPLGNVLCHAPRMMTVHFLVSYPGRTLIDEEIGLLWNVRCGRDFSCHLIDCMSNSVPWSSGLSGAQVRKGESGMSQALATPRPTSIRAVPLLFFKQFKSKEGLEKPLILLNSLVWQLVTVRLRWRDLPRITQLLVAKRDFLAAILALDQPGHVCWSSLLNLMFLVCPVTVVWHSSGSPLVLMYYGPLVL